MSPPTLAEPAASAAEAAAARKAASAANANAAAAGGGKSKLSLRKKRKKTTSSSQSSSSATSKNGKGKKDSARKRRAISDVFAARRARSGDHSAAAAAGPASLTAAAVDVDDKVFRFGEDTTSSNDSNNNDGGGDDDGGAMSSPGESTVEDSQDSVVSIGHHQDSASPIKNGIGPSSSSGGAAAVFSSNKENGTAASRNGQQSQSASSSAVALEASSLVAGGSAAASSSSSSLLLQSAKKRKRDGGIPIPSFSPVEELPSSPPRKSRGDRSKERTKSSSGDSVGGTSSGGKKRSTNSRSKKTTRSGTGTGSTGGSKERIKVTKSKKQIGADTPEVSRSTGTPASETKGRLGSSNDDDSGGAATSATSSGDGGKKVAVQEADSGAASTIIVKEDALAKVEAALAKAAASASGKAASSIVAVDQAPVAAAAADDDSLGVEPSDRGQNTNAINATSAAAKTQDNAVVIDIANSSDEDQPFKDDGSGDTGKARDGKTSGSLKDDTLAPKKTTGKSTKKATKPTKTTSKKGKMSAATTIAKAKGQTKRRRTKKQEPASSTASPTDNTFEVPRSKRLADQEKTLERAHADLLRRLAKKPSPGKESGVETEGEATKRPAKRSLCTLCSTCSCSRGAALTGLEEGAKAEAKNPLSGLARSDAEVERALLGRLARLEKSASWFDTLSYKVGRELKKHRNKVMKKRVSLGGAPDSKVEKPRFLADAEVEDKQQNGMFYPRAKKTRVARAHQGLFGTGPSSVKEAQPTLTQMMRGETGETGDEDADDDTGADHNIPQGCALEAIAEEGGDPEEKEKACFHVGEEEVSNDYIVYEESGDGSPSSVRSPLADFHDASRRGVERTAEASRIGAWDAATTCTGIGGSEVLGASETDKGAEDDDDFDQKVDDAVEKIEDGGIDDLLVLFQDQPPSDGDVTEIQSNPPTPERQQELQSQLTQRGLGAVEQLQEGIMADPVKLQAIEASCPNWQDNIRFPFLHTNPADVGSALANVRESRKKLSEARKRILTALQQRDETLALFESSLEQSMNRFADSEHASSGEEKKSEPRWNES